MWQLMVCVIGAGGACLPVPFQPSGMVFETLDKCVAEVTAHGAGYCTRVGHCWTTD
jgi:hypothetical protein